MRANRAAVLEEDSQREAADEEGRAPGTPEPPAPSMRVTRAARAARQLPSPLHPQPQARQTARLGKRKRERRTTQRLTEDAERALGMSANSHDNPHSRDRSPHANARPKRAPGAVPRALRAAGAYAGSKHLCCGGGFRRRATDNNSTQYILIITLPYTFPMTKPSSVGLSEACY